MKQYGHIIDDIVGRGDNERERENICGRERGKRDRRERAIKGGRKL